MKVEIKINHATLSELCYSFDVQSFHSTNVPEQKALLSIIQDLSKKLLKKEIDKRETTKKFKISFKYHEAYALEKYCREMYFSFQEKSYLALMAHDIANQIHEQL
ncbi:MAG: hypothetical protein WCY77_10145 [Weeksellaceae bacterium]